MYTCVYVYVCTRIHVYTCIRACATLRKLGKNEDLYISKPDKGNGIVILNRSDYVTKMEDLLADRSKFVVVDDNCYKLTQRLESRLNKILLSLHKAGKLDKNVYNDLRALSSRLGKLYGLPKTLKNGVPLRLILSSQLQISQISCSDVVGSCLFKMYCLRYIFFC